MSKKINGSIRLRTDTISNWFLNKNSILQKNELIVVDFEDGTIGLKFGSGASYQSTPFIKFLNVCAGSLTDGTNTFTFPSKSGTLVLNEDLTNQINTILSNKNYISSSGGTISGTLTASNLSSTDITATNLNVTTSMKIGDKTLMKYVQDIIDEKLGDIESILESI